MSFLLNSILALLNLIFVALLWQSPVFLTIILIVMSTTVLFAEKNRSLLVLYVFVAVSGPLAEAFSIWFGAWQYAMPGFIGIPIWLFPLWGNAALFIFALNKKLSQLRRLY